MSSFWKVVTYVWAGRCECRRPLNARRVHLLRCPHGGGTTVGHDAVRDAVASIASEAGFCVGHEQRHLLPRGDPHGAHRRVDLLFTDDGGGHSLGDVVVADPTRSLMCRVTLDIAHIAGFWGASCL